MQLVEKEVTVKGNRVTYFDEGPQDGVPIIFIHGFPFNKGMWRRQFDDFAETNRVIAYDVRGHGRSASGKTEFSVVGFAADLLDFMDVMSLEKSAVCGLSMGGYIALNAIEKNPERLAALVLCDTQCNADSAEAKEKRIKTIAMVRLGGLKKFAEDMLNNLFAPASLDSMPGEVDLIRESILQTGADTVCKTLQALANRKDACDDLAKTKIPVLIMVGKEDKVTPPEASQKMHELIPGSGFEIIEGAGHLSSIENTEAFNAHLSKFLKELFQDIRA